MKKLLLISAMMFSVSAKAYIGGSMVVNPDNSEANLILSDTGEGDLSSFYDQMYLKETLSENTKSKSFVLKNGRFGFVCEKGLIDSTIPWTRCSFFIKNGENTTATSTLITKIEDENIADIAMSRDVALEMSGIFPTEEDLEISYAIRAPNNVIFNVGGSTLTHMSIGFSSK